MAPFDGQDEFARAENARREEVMKAPVDPVLDTLVKAREWLSDPAHWCQGHLILDANGIDCGMTEAPAASCAWGAINLAKGCTSGSSSEEYALLESLCGHERLQYFNDADATTHADVLALYDRAITARRGA